MEKATKSLIKKLEAAAEGSRELDAEIFLECDDYGLEIQEHLKQPMAHYTREGWIACVAGQSAVTPHYTTSLDAKLPDENIIEMSWDEDDCSAWHITKDGTLSEGRAPTEALARRIAVLKGGEG